MKVLQVTILLLSILISGCIENRYGTVVEILACSDASSYNYVPKCRVILNTGERVTIVAPVAVGDRVIYDYSTHNKKQVNGAGRVF